MLRGWTLGSCCPRDERAAGVAAASPLARSWPDMGGWEIAGRARTSPGGHAHPHAIGPGAAMITLYSYPSLFGVADNNGYGLKVFAFLRLANLPFVHEHIFDAS